MYKRQIIVAVVATAAPACPRCGINKKFKIIFKTAITSMVFRALFSYPVILRIFITGPAKAFVNCPIAKSINHGYASDGLYTPKIPIKEDPKNNTIRKIEPAVNKFN